jgi:hypothetical protein
MQWYPAEWRERYGDEFEAVLSSSMSDGKGGLRLSGNVVREGIMARLELAGFVGRLAPPLERARASVVTVFVAVVGFLAGAAGIAYYATGWQETLAADQITAADRTFLRSPAAHAYRQTLLSPAFESLKRASYSQPANVQAWRALEGARARATNALDNTAAYRALQQAFRHPRPASAVPVALGRVTQLTTDAVIACLGLMLVVATVAWARDLRRGSSRGLLIPMGLVVAAGAVFVLGEIAYRAFGRHAPGGLFAVRWIIVRRDLQLWPQAVFPLATVASVVLLAIGGVKLVRRIRFSPGLCRVMTALAVAAGLLIGVSVMATLSWAVILGLQAPGFLTTDGRGIFGSPLLPTVTAAIVVMAGSGWMVVNGSDRSLRIVRSL